MRIPAALTLSLLLALSAACRADEPAQATEKPVSCATSCTEAFSTGHTMCSYSSPAALDAYDQLKGCMRASCIDPCRQAIFNTTEQRDSACDGCLQDECGDALAACSSP